MRASWYVKTKYEPASIYQFRSAVVHFMSLATLFWWTGQLYRHETMMRVLYNLHINHSMLWWSHSFHKLKQKVWHRAPKGRACIKCARQKGVSVKNTRGRFSARAAENAVWTLHNKSSRFYGKLPHQTLKCPWIITPTLKNSFLVYISQSYGLPLKYWAGNSPNYICIPPFIHFRAREAGNFEPQLLDILKNLLLMRSALEKCDVSLTV